MRGWKGIGLIGLAAATGIAVAAPAHAVTASTVGTSSGASTASAGIRISATAATTSTSPNLSNYVPVSPFRILDTRSGSCVQCSGLALGPGTKRKLQLTGLSVGTDPIPTDASAVVLNVTEVGATATSILTLYPYGGVQPEASNLNFGPRTVIPNLVTVTVGQGGAVVIYNAVGSVNVLADVEGYFEPEQPSDITGEFHAIAPVRVCDTRHNSATPVCSAKGAVGQTPLIVNVTGAVGSVSPQTAAEAAVLNLTGLAGSKPTLLSVFPTSSNGTCAYNASHAPPFSTLNLSAGEVRANRVMVQLGPSAPGGANTSICVYNAAGSTNVVLDANGWFGSGTAQSGAQYESITPTRICDTRSGSKLPCAGKTLGSQGIDSVVVAGEAGLPTTAATSPAVAVIANLTAIAPTAATYLTIYPANQSGHSVSDINLSAGQVVPNLAVVAVDITSGDLHNGDVDLFNAAGKVNALIDLEGWFQLTYPSGISGTVSDTQTPAQPIADATITYTGANGSGSTTSNAGGAYTLSNVRPGTYTVTAAATGFTSPAPQLATVTANTVATANVSLTATSSISGGVFDTQTPAQPVVGATVTYAGTNGNTAAGTTTTNSSGDFAFSGVSPRTYTLAGTDSAYTSPSPQTVLVTAGNAAIETVSMTANSGITGTLDDSGSQPVFYATVTYTGTGSDTASGSTTTDINGDYAFGGVSPGTYTVAVADTGYTTPSQTVTVNAGGTASSDFVLASLHARKPLLQPFTTTSIWNRPIGSDAQYMPANLIPASLYTLRSDQHVIVMTPTAPLTPIVENTAGPSGDQNQRCDTSGAFVVNAPIPADFEVLSTDQNDPLTAVAADGHTLIQGEPFALCTAGGPGTIDFYDTKNIDGDIDGDGLQGWDGGSHLSALGGAIRLGELVPDGVIDHALQIDVEAPNLYQGTAATCFVWPATRCDSYGPTGYGGTNPKLAMGALLALPPTLNLNSLGLDPAGLILAKAFQDYGAYIANDADRSVNNIVTELSPSGSVAGVYDASGNLVAPGQFQTDWGVPFDTVGVNGTDKWSQDIATIFANLQIVTNNAAGWTAGGGTPLAPFAPPL
jgi:protocatechuate 3,4-dioxygenase beta subunit